MASISYRQLEDAFRYKSLKRRTADDFRFGDKGPGFTLPYEGKGGIFDQARNRLLPSFYTKDFADNEKGHLEMADSIIKTIDVKEMSLEAYCKPLKAAERDKEALSGAITTSKQADTQTPPPLAGGEASASMTGGSATPPTTPNLPRPPLAPETKAAQEAEAAATMESAAEGQTAPFGTGFQMPRTPGLFAKAGSNLGSSVGINLRKLINRDTITATFTTIVGGTVGYKLAGNPGAFFGGVFGFGMTQAAKGGLLGPLASWVGTTSLRVGNGVVSASSRISRQVAGSRSFGRSIVKKTPTFVWIFLGFLLMFLVFAGIGASLLPIPGNKGQPPSATSQQLAVSLAGPGGCTDSCQVDNNQEITYEISFTYSGSGSAAIEVSGKVPDGVNLSRAFSENWNVTSGTFSQVITGVPSKQEKKIPLTFKPDNGKADFWASHNVSASIIKINLPENIISGGNEAPNSDTCSGVYSSGLYPIQSNPIHANFGDPSCTFSQPQDRDKLYVLLKQLDPAQAAFWFWLAEAESSYIPNAFNGGSPDSGGAWGLYQTGSSKNGPGTPGEGTGGPYDRGDVPWPLQINNAVQLKNQLESLGFGFKSDQSYWQPAKPAYCNRSNPPASCRNKPN